MWTRQPFTEATHSLIGSDPLLYLRRISESQQGEKDKSGRAGQVKSVEAMVGLEKGIRNHTDVDATLLLLYLTL